MIILNLPDFTSSNLESSDSLLTLSASKRMILASLNSFLSSDSSSFVPNPLCMIDGCLQSGQQDGTFSV